MNASPFVLPRSEPVREGTGVMDFSDGCLVLAVAIAVFWAVDPFGLQLWRSFATRHIPILVAVSATFLGAAGRFLNRPAALEELLGAFRTYLALSLLALFIVAGSLYARLALDNDNTFITIGVYLVLGGPVNLWLITTSRAPLTMIRSITGVLFFVSLLGVLSAAARPGVLVYHSVEHIVLVGVAFPLFLDRRVWLRAIGALLLFIGTLAPNRLTGFIVMLAIFGWLYLDALLLWAKRDPDKVRGALRICVGIFAASALVVALLLVYQSTKSHLADGNTVFRTHNYELAFNRFLDSWIWGRGFAGSSVDYFDVFVVNASTQFLPTHSDPLDIMANGGLLGTIPFVVGLASIIWVGWKALDAGREPKSQQPRDLRPHLVMYFLIAVTGISVMTFNPVLNQASLAYSYWTATAIVYALANLMKRAAVTTEAVPQHQQPQQRRRLA